MQRITSLKNEKSGRKIIIVAIGVILILIILLICKNVNKKDDITKVNNLNYIKDEKENVNEFVDENVIIEEDNDKNEVKNTLIKDKKINTSNITTNPGITDKKQEAIELVKKEWGEDNSVSFAFDYVDNNGEYIIAVKENANVIFRFKVNLDSKKVEVYY